MIRSLISQRDPNAIALLAPGRPPITYHQLGRQVEEVVAALNTAGVGRDDRVAVVLPNGPEMAVAFLGVAAGATCAPLNSAYRAHEFDFYLADLQAKALIVATGFDSPARESARRLGISIIELSIPPEAEAGRFTLSAAATAKAHRPGFADVEDVALVLHTSGTTSRPKLVPLSHRNLCVSAENIVSTLQLTVEDRCLNVMPLFHIHGLVGVLLSSLAAGASIVCSPGFDERPFFEWLVEFHPSWYSAVPTMHQAIVAHAERNPNLLHACQIRLIRSSSASLPPQVMARLESVFAAPVIESYGMTEAAHQMSSNPLPPGTRKPGSVGLAAGPAMAIMDDAGNFLPAGEVGEIVIRGDNVTAGYANDPQANAAAFTKGWFRTGDQGRVDAEGYFYLVGRLKEIINRGGEKVAPREVDEVLLEHPCVVQAVTFAVPHDRLGEDVAAAIVLREGSSTSASEVRQFAFDQLAHHKVPSQIVIVDAIPKGPTGKLQRIGLHIQLAEALASEFVSPGSATEQQLAAIWSALLRLSGVGINDHFFALGGDSLLATRLVSRIRSEFNVEMSPSTVFRQPTLIEQASEIEAELRAAHRLQELELAELVDDLDRLTDEEATRLLAEEARPTEDDPRHASSGVE